jgi:hypothetical protein
MGHSLARPWPGTLRPWDGWRQLLECGGRLKQRIDAWEEEKIDHLLPVVFSFRTQGFTVKVYVELAGIAWAPLAFAGDTAGYMALVVEGRQSAAKGRSILESLYAGA